MRLKPLNIECWSACSDWLELGPTDLHMYVSEFWSSPSLHPSTLLQLWYSGTNSHTQVVLEIAHWTSVVGVMNADNQKVCPHSTEANRRTLLDFHVKKSLTSCRREATTIYIHVSVAKQLPLIVQLHVHVQLPHVTWPFTFWPWKWCLVSHVWRGLPLWQF